MPTTKPRCTVTFEDERLRELVDEFRFENRYKSQNDAIMALINKGIEVLTGEVVSKPREELTKEDKRVLRAYHSALPVIQSAALKMLEDNPVISEKDKAV